MEKSILIAMSLGFVIFAQADGKAVVLTPSQLFGLCALLSMLGGLGAAMRRDVKTEIADLISHALNMSILGTCIGMIMYSWVKESQVWIWAIAGVCGLLGLAGLPAIEWVHGLAKKYVTEKVKAESK
jgi:hypothetical protein